MTKWKPKTNDKYYVPHISVGNIDYFDCVWYDDGIDNQLYKVGLVCKTEDEALELARKMLEVAKERVGNEFE